MFPNEIQIDYFFNIQSHQITSLKEMVTKWWMPSKEITKGPPASKNAKLRQKFLRKIGQHKIIWSSDIINMKTARKKFTLLLHERHG